MHTPFAGSRGLSTLYSDPGFEVAVSYLLAGGAPGTGVSALFETVQVRNLGNSPLDFHFFVETDFDLNGTADFDTSVLARPDLWTQYDGQISARVSATPTPDHFETAFYPDTLLRLLDSDPSTLSDFGGPLGPGDVAWAWQWDFSLAPGATFEIDLVKQIPLPSSVSLIVAGLVAAILARAARPRRRSRTTFVGLALVICLALPRAAMGQGSVPQPIVTFPEDGAVISDIALVVAEQANASVLPTDIAVTRFEYSTDLINWVVFWEATDTTDNTRADDLDRWDTRLDTGPLASGLTFLRVTMETSGGDVGFSPPVEIVVNKTPIANAAATPGLVRGSVVFDGTRAVYGPPPHDPDGQIVDWSWDFGDGSLGSGPVVQHAYVDLRRPYEVTLTVTDDLGTTGTAHFLLVFTRTTAVKFKQDAKCICKKIELRGDNLPAEKDALGADGVAGGEDWSVPKDEDGHGTDGDDGKTLGPLHTNPGNRTVGGEKEWTGYSFEIVAEVDGDPALCKEIQVVKGTIVRKGLTQIQCARRQPGSILMPGEFVPAAGGNPSMCTTHHHWKGKTPIDLDKDGIHDINVSTEAECLKAGGSWDGSRCLLKFPQAGTPRIGPPGGFGPDVPDDRHPAGAYERPFSFKKHPDKKIIWFDTVNFRLGGNGSTKKADFVAIVRGTDRKYCYVAFRVDTERRDAAMPGNPAGVDKETLTVTDEKVGELIVPGVP